MTALTVEELGRRLRAREMTALEATELCLRRIEADNARLNAFILVTADEARRQAREADRELASGLDRGPLHGVPISIKDILDIEGLPTTAASRVRAGHRAPADAPAIVNLRRAGAVFVGKTNLHEFAFGTTNEDSAYGPARNPHDPARSPGGSSGGSAASVATGMALASIGTDTGGSIRIPAAACGIVGLKPTYGEIKTGGVVPLARSFDHVGPLTRTVTDAWLVYSALLGAPAPRLLTAPPMASLRLSVLRQYFCDLLDEEVRQRFEEAIASLQAAGARIGEASVAHAKDIAPAYMHLSIAEAATYHETMLEEKPELYTPPVRMRLEMGRYVLAQDYVRASMGREILRDEVEHLFAGCDALVLPTLPIPAPLIGADTVRIGSSNEPVRALMLRLTQLFNMTGDPTISIPCGTTAAGLPCGLQIVGRRANTEALARVALACEAHVAAGDTLRA